MATTKRYLQSTKNLPEIMKKIIEGVPPEKFNNEHLKGLGFQSSNDRSVIGVLKDLGFLTDDGVPTERYHAYRDSSQSKAVMAKAIKETYPDIFYVSEKPDATNRDAIRGKFKTMHRAGDSVADKMVLTFYALLDLADLDALDAPSEENDLGPQSEQAAPAPASAPIPTSRSLVKADGPSGTNLHYNIQIHLPATRDAEVFNAIFKSLRENLLG